MPPRAMIASCRLTFTRSRRCPRLLPRCELNALLCFFFSFQSNIPQKVSLMSKEIHRYTLVAENHLMVYPTPVNLVMRPVFQHGLGCARVLELQPPPLLAQPLLVEHNLGSADNSARKATIPNLSSRSLIFSARSGNFSLFSCFLSFS